MLSSLLLILHKIRYAVSITHIKNSFLYPKAFKSFKGKLYKPHLLAGMKYISIGENTQIQSGVILTAWDRYKEQRFSPEIEIGNNTDIGEFCHISSVNKIQIGNGVLTGRYVYISDNSHGKFCIEQINTMPVERPLHIKGPVIIEDNVWIGERVCILSGVHIGKGAIIGANAVVTHDIPAGCMAAGIPAIVIKEL